MSETMDCEATGNQDLFQLLKSGTVKQVKAEISGIDTLNCRDEHGNSPLMLAVSRPQGFSLAHLLIQAGAAVNGTNRLGEAPLLSASWAGNMSAVKLLLKYGADPNLASRSGYTPLMAAADNGNAEIVSTLLMHGADADARNRRGVTAIMRAGEQGYHEIAGLLADHGAKPCRSRSVA